MKKDLCDESTELANTIPDTVRYYSRIEPIKTLKMALNFMESGATEIEVHLKYSTIRLFC